MSAATFLTERQKAILDFILASQEERGVAPTHREICEEFGYSSYGTVHKHLKILEKKGYLRRTDHQKRGIEVVVDEGTTDRTGDRSRDEVPFFGLIAAGQPIESVPGHDRVPVPPQFLGGRKRSCYALRVTGTSMIDEGVHDGDVVVVEQRDVARAGEMVVALVEGEATLKRYYPEGPTVRLQPANAAMAPIRVPADDVRIQGVVVGLMRQY